MYLFLDKNLDDNSIFQLLTTRMKLLYAIRAIEILQKKAPL